MNQSRNFIDQIVKKACSLQFQSPKAKHQEQEDSLNNKLIIRRANKRLFNIAKHSSTLNPFHHVYSFLKSFSINQKSLQNQDYDECIFRSWFYHKVVTRVEKYQNAVVMCVAPSSDVLKQPQQKQFVSNLNLFKKTRNSNLVTILEEILSLISQQKNNVRKGNLEGDSYSVTKILNSFKDDMFICKLGLNRMAISYSLLTHLGIDVDQFCIQTIKYRTVVFEQPVFQLVSCLQRVILKYYVTCQNIQEMFLLFHRARQRNLNQFNRKRQHFLISFMAGITQKSCLIQMKSYCDIQVNFPIPQVLLIRVGTVHYQVNELQWKKKGSFDSDYSREKQKINQKQFQLLYQLQNEPEQKRPKSKFASYNYINVLKN